MIQWYPVAFPPWEQLPIIYELLSSFSWDFNGFQLACPRLFYGHWIPCNVSLGGFVHDSTSIFTCMVLLILRYGGLTDEEYFYMHDTLDLQYDLSDEEYFYMHDTLDLQYGLTDEEYLYKHDILGFTRWHQWWEIISKYITLDFTIHCQLIFHCSLKHRSLMLTHLPLDKMTAISQTIYSGEFSWMKSPVFLLKFHWSLSPMIQLIITQHWFR